MWPRLSIVAGLLAGVVVAGLLIGGVLFVGPEPALAPSSTPLAVVSASPSADASGGPSLAPSVAPTPTASATAPFHVGETAPTLVVRRVGGGTIDLANLRGKPVWVNFMGTDSPPSRDEFPLMNGFAARYAANGLVVVAIDVHEDEATVASFANELGATFPLGLDADGSAAERWGALALPVHFWIDAKGVVRHGALGGIGPDLMAAGVQSILPGVEVTP